MALTESIAGKDGLLVSRDGKWEAHLPMVSDAMPLLLCPTWSPSDTINGSLLPGPAIRSIQVKGKVNRKMRPPPLSSSGAVSSASAAAPATQQC